MKVTSIQIQRFGVWQQLTLPVSGRGLNVFYGPNEAGKTTLLRFIRGVLYGFEPFGVEVRDGKSRSPNWEGALHVERDGRPYEIRRISDRGTRGLVSVVGSDRQEPAERLLSELLHRTDETVFENVFAVGLEELQELATLQGDDVARHIYGMTLGPTGRKLLDASAAVEHAVSRLFSPAARSGTLVDLLEREQSLREEAAGRQSLREEHAEMSASRGRIEDRIDAVKRKQSDAERQLRAHHVLERAWPHWNQVREYRQVLDAIPHVSAFPKDGLDQLRKLEVESAAAAQSHRNQLDEIKALRTQRDGLRQECALGRHAAALAGLVEQRDWYRETSQRADDAEIRTAQLKTDFDRSLASLGKDWSPARLETVEPGWDAYRKLTAAASRYRAVSVRRRRLVGLHKRLNRAVRKRAAVVEEWLKQLNGASLDDAIAAQKTRLEELEASGRLRLHAVELHNRRDGLTTLLHRLDERVALPKWISLFLAALLFGGILIVMIGLWDAAARHNVLSGSSLGLAGLSGLAVAWGLKRHAEIDSHETIDGYRAHLRQIDVQLRETREALARLGGDHKADADTPPQPVVTAAGTVKYDRGQRMDDAERLHEETRRLAELEAMNQTRLAIHARRRRLAELRSRFQNAQREVSAERQNWCALLQGLGLPETVKIDEALEAWRGVAEARERLRAWRSADDEATHVRKSVESFRGRLAEAGRRAGGNDYDEMQPLDVLTAWAAELKSLDRARDEWRRLRRELKERRRKAAQAARRVRELRFRLKALFVKGGAADRAEFLQRADWVARREECEELLALANEDLHSAANADPELAIVEEHLRDFDADENGRRIESLTAALDELGRDLQAAYEELGSVKQSLRAMEANRESSRLRFEESQTRHELKRAAEEWFGLQLAGQAVDRVRTKFERSCQPAALALASKYLERLTRGRYRNIWTPLGKRELCVDDDRGHTLRVEQLSGGTREQLFLAVRMATIRELSQQGIELPMVLDDVLVNFDQVRTEAAVDALREFADENQQVLFFTCHLHLAHMFEGRGLEPTWLPGHNLPLEERRAG